MFSKNPVLKALGILTAEDIRELSSYEEAIVAFKQAAGGEWVSSETSVVKAKSPKKMGEVIPFPKREKTNVLDLPQIEASGEEVPVDINELTTDFILSQRKLAQKVVEQASSKHAFSEYTEQVNLLIVQDKDMGGKRRIRFVPTHGVLINKKQS